MLTPEQRSLRSRAAAHRLHALGRTNTAPARAAYKNRFLTEVDPDGVLSPEERERRAAHALKAHMASLALKSAVARSKRTAS